MPFIVAIRLLSFVVCSLLGPLFPDHLLFGVLFIVSIGSLFPLHMQGDQNARVSHGNPHASSTEVEETYQKEGVDGGDGRRFELEL